MSVWDHRRGQTQQCLKLLAPPRRRPSGNSRCSIRTPIACSGYPVCILACTGKEHPAFRSLPTCSNTHLKLLRNSPCIPMARQASCLPTSERSSAICAVRVSVHSAASDARIMRTMCYSCSKAPRNFSYLQTASISVRLHTLRRPTDRGRL